MSSNELSNDASVGPKGTTEELLRDFALTFGEGAQELIIWHRANTIAYKSAINAQYAFTNCMKVLRNRGMSERDIARYMGLPKSTIRSKIEVLRDIHHEFNESDRYVVQKANIDDVPRLKGLKEELEQIRMSDGSNVDTVLNNALYVNYPMHMFSSIDRHFLFDLNNTPNSTKELESTFFDTKSTIDVSRAAKDSTSFAWRCLPVALNDLKDAGEFQGVKLDRLISSYIDAYRDWSKMIDVFTEAAPFAQTAPDFTYRNWIYMFEQLDKYVSAYVDDLDDVAQEAWEGTLWRLRDALKQSRDTYAFKFEGAGRPLLNAADLAELNQDFVATPWDKICMDAYRRNAMSDEEIEREIEFNRSQAVGVDNKSEIPVRRTTFVKRNAPGEDDIVLVSMKQAFHHPEATVIELIPRGVVERDLVQSLEMFRANPDAYFVVSRDRGNDDV